MLVGADPLPCCSLWKDGRSPLVTLSAMPLPSASRVAINIGDGCLLPSIVATYAQTNSCVCPVYLQTLLRPLLISLVKSNRLKRYIHFEANCVRGAVPGSRVPAV